MSVPLNMAKLDEIAELNPSLAETMESDALVSFVPMAAISAETASVMPGEERRYYEVGKGYTPFLNGDLLVAKITPCFENGKIAQATLSRRVGFGSTEFHVVRPHVEKADTRYLLHFLRQESVRRDGEQKMTGSAGQRRVPEHYLANLRIPVPPLKEQRRIAAILDRAEAVRAKRRAALAQLDALIQAIFLDMFGDPEENPKSWSLMPLMKLCSPKQWPTISMVELMPSGFPVFGANGLIGYYTEYNHEEPTILITCRGATCGTINLSPRKCYVTGNAMALDKLDTKHITIEYFAATLRIRKMVDTISGSAQPQITRQNLQLVKIPLPPLQLQSEFARRVGVVEKLKAAHRASLAELDALFAALQHRAFRGELDPVVA